MQAFKKWVGKVVHRILPRRLAALYDKYSEALWYVFFGVMTTLVNFTVYLLLTRVLFTSAFEKNETLTTAWANLVAWFFAVLAAFYFNRNFVFDGAGEGRSIWFQFGSFFTARLASGVLFETLLPLGLVALGLHDLLAKGLAAVINIVANYFFSKFISFRKTPIESTENTDIPSEE